jgi:cytochrome c peroxidase
MFMRLTYLFLALIALFATSCTRDEPIEIIDNHVTTPYELPQPRYFPTTLNIPADNPMTVEGVTLGRYLYYDGRLNGRTHCDSMQSCYSCHIQETGFTTSNPTGRGEGVTGKYTPHTVMPHVNLVYRDQPAFGWAGGSASLEDVVKGVFLLDYEFATTHEIAIETIENIPIYPPMFKAAFGTEEVNIDRIAKAIAQFMRSLVSYNSRFDKFVRHEINLTAKELRGYELFMSEKADCFHCHGEMALLTNNLFMNNAIDSVLPGVDDRYSVTGDPRDLGKFITPTLRNVALRKSFMHDGRFTTLKEVVDHYSHGVVNSPTIDPLMKYAAFGGTQLTEEEKADLIAFLHTFTDEEFISDPKFGRPKDLNTGCPE